MIDAQDSDLFDFLAYVRFTLAPKARIERAESARSTAPPPHDAEMPNFLESVLRAYERGGVEELGLDSLSTLSTVKYGSLNDTKARLGELASIKTAFVGMQADLYRD